MLDFAVPELLCNQVFFNWLHIITELMFLLLWVTFFGWICIQSSSVKYQLTQQRYFSWGIWVLFWWTTYVQTLKLHYNAYMELLRCGEGQDVYFCFQKSDPFLSIPKSKLRLREALAAQFPWIIIDLHQPKFKHLHNETLFIFFLMKRLRV